MIAARVRQPRVSTRTGDDGRTSLWGKQRVAKHDPRIVVVGDLDEAQSAMGLARALTKKRAVAVELLALQRDLYELMAEVAASPEKEPTFRVDAKKVSELDRRLERLKDRAAIPPKFVVPGEDPASASIDLARTVVRRAERGVARLLDEGLLTNRDVLRYLNRLSDALFVIARWEEGRRKRLARAR
jgi:cob(I)alamin adenosyltransferase